MGGRGGDRDLLLLSAGEALQSLADRHRRRELRERPADPVADPLGRKAEVLHRERQLIFHRIHHELCLGILKDETHQVGHAAGCQRDRIAAEHVGPARPRFRQRRADDPLRAGAVPDCA